MALGFFGLVKKGGSLEQKQLIRKRCFPFLTVFDDIGFSDPHFPYADLCPDFFLSEVPVPKCFSRLKIK